MPQCGQALVSVSLALAILSLFQGCDLKKMRLLFEIKIKSVFDSDDKKSKEISSYF
jgi:hypothetical protein